MCILAIHTHSTLNGRVSRPNLLNHRKFRKNTVIKVIHSVINFFIKNLHWGKHVLSWRDSRVQYKCATEGNENENVLSRDYHALNQHLS
jgi:hypothetical protein